MSSIVVLKKFCYIESLVCYEGNHTYEPSLKNLKRNCRIPAQMSVSVILLLHVADIFHVYHVTRINHVTRIKLMCIPITECTPLRTFLY